MPCEGVFVRCFTLTFCDCGFIIEEIGGYMKRIFFSILICILVTSSATADELRLDKETQFQKKVMQIGFKILNDNQIEKRMTFYYSPRQNVNASTYLSSKQITLYKGILPFVDSDDELAAILSHEIAHGVDAHRGLWRRIMMNSHSPAFEFKADQKGADYMVKAGYNPVALIVILNKIAGEPNWFERSSTHPEGSARLVALYDYIYATYPQYLINNAYKSNIYYQNFLLTTKKERKEIREKYTPKTKNLGTKVSL